MNRTQLLSRITENFRAMKRALTEKAHDHQSGTLPFGQAAALSVIAGHQPTNIKLIARQLFITSGAATQHVEALVQEGLVSRTTDPDDRRNVQIVMTLAGTAMSKKLAKVHSEHMAVLFGDLSDEELQLFNRALEKVISKIQN
jgi:DNA-binding MarR family transcriptional regulator